MQKLVQGHNLLFSKGAWCLLFFLQFFCATSLFSNNSSSSSYLQQQAGVNGTIRGVISDAENNEFLVGVFILMKGTSLGSSTDINGQYVIKGIPPGVYTISISYMGYETSMIADVTVAAGESTTLNHKLNSSSTLLKDIEIIGDKSLSGKVIETNEHSLINSIKLSSLIVTGISSQQIARSVDQDAGEVAKRLPGVTVLSNFVNIRGMHERYNLTILNGMVAPSAEADKRAFSYDLLPSNMIDKMTVYRSPAPELLADWAGGVIKIETKNSSVAREIEVSLTTSYRSNSSFSDYYTYEGGKKDWLGKDDGTRALPDGFPEVAAIPAGGLTDLSNNTRDLSKFTAEEITANATLARSLYNKWNVKKESSGLDYRAGLNYYDSRKFGKMRLSNLTSINTTQSSLVRYQEFNPRLTVKNGIPLASANVRSSYRDTISQQTSRWGVLQNLALIINPKHTISLNGLFNQLGIDELYVRNGFEATGDYPGYITKLLYTYRSRTLFGIQASGKHIFGNDESLSHSVTWTAAYNSSKEETPAQRSVIFQPKPIEGPENAPRYLSFNINRFNINNSLFYSDTKETNSIFSLDYEKKLKFGPTLKGGLFSEDKFKPLNSRLIRNRDVVQQTDGFVTEHNVDDAFQLEIYKDDGSGAFISDDAQLSGQYTATGKIYAGYGAVNIPLFQDKLKVYGGARYEGQQLLLVIPPSEYLIRSLGKKTELINRYVFYWLPSVNVSYSFTEKIALRAAYGKTINRPNFREFIPIFLFDPRLENRKIGNDTLKDAQIHNWDMRLEYYSADGEFISIGAYYKKLINAIEPYVIQELNNEDIHYDNTKRATVLGVEAEVRKSFNFLPWKWGGNLSAIANFAILKSTIELREGLVDNTTGNFRDSRSTTRPLEGTPKFVVNTGLYYEIKKWGSKISAIYNIAGQRLVAAGTVDFPDTYELPRHALDITLRQPITKYLEFRAGVQDVLNQPRRLYRDYDRDQLYNPAKRNKLPQNDWIYQSFKPGRYITIGVNLKL